MPMTKFWKTFATSIWEKKVLLKKNFKSPLSEIKEAEIFSMLVEYSNLCRKLKNLKGIRFYVQGQLYDIDKVLQILPEKKDQSLSGYHSRMKQNFSDYCLVCDELWQMGQKNWRHLSKFTENIFQHVGMPNRYVEMGFYLGNYRKTPFGVHLDSCGVFSFPVVGEKKFRLWTPTFVKKNPALVNAHHYGPYKKKSQLLVAAPGDMTYWPSSAWHIAESNGSFSATWSLGFWVDRSLQENLEDALRPLLLSKLGSASLQITTSLQKLQKDGNVKDLPRSYLQSISILKNLSKNELYNSLLRAWLELRSKQGFRSLASENSRPRLSLQSRIQISNSLCIMWSKLRMHPRTLVAIQGTVIEVPNSPGLLRLIKALNVGKVCLIDDYLKGPHKKRDLKSLQIISKTGCFSK